MKSVENIVRLARLAVPVGRFFWRRKRLTLALAAGLLILGPLLTGTGGGAFFLNLVGLGIAALVVRRIVQANNRKQAARARQANCRCRCHRGQQTAKQQLGGTP